VRKEGRKDGREGNKKGGLKEGRGGGWKVRKEGRKWV
jgi:hypothetical protein